MVNYASKRYATGRKSTAKCGRRTTTIGGSRGLAIPRGYQQINGTFACKIRSYRTLWEQTKGAARKTRPTPATLKTFSHWIDKGANVWRITNVQINKWCKTNQTYKTTSAAKMALCHMFGKATIKAVCGAKSGGYIVATAPMCKGKPFEFPV